MPRAAREGILSDKIMWSYVGAVMVLWIALSVKELYVLFYPPACKLRHGCYHPRLPWGARVDITAHMGEGAIRAAVWNVTNVSSVEELEAAITTPVPPSVRRGEMRELWLTFELSRTGSDDVLSAARVNLVQMYEARERSQASMLLERDVFGDVFASSDEKPAVTEAPSTSSTVSAELAPADRHGRVPHFIYSYRMCELRLVTDARAYASPFLSPDGTPIGQSWDVHARTYTPHLYVDTFSLLRKHALPLSADVQKAHPWLKLKFKPISIGRHRIMAQLGSLFEALGASLGLGTELDEIRELLSEERLYRFVVMQVECHAHASLMTSIDL